MSTDCTSNMCEQLCGAQVAHCNLLDREIVQKLRNECVNAHTCPKGVLPADPGLAVCPKAPKPPPPEAAGWPNADGCPNPAVLVAPKAPPPACGCPNAVGWPNPEEPPNTPPGFAGCPNALPSKGELLCAGAEAAPKGEAAAAGVLPNGEAAAEDVAVPPKTPPPGAAGGVALPKGVDGIAGWETAPTTHQQQHD